MTTRIGILYLLVGFSSSLLFAESENANLTLLKNSQRIVFLGDSITFAGHYVSYFETWLITQSFENAPTVINVGLPSETVSGLSEEGHAGGKFPRPHLAERLDRVLAVTKPDLVFACYGMNCGIYKPIDEQRFAKYQQGIMQLKEKVEASGATFVVITPPVFDDQVAKKTFSYDAVLAKYAAWLVDQREKGWLVIDLHSAMKEALEQQRKQEPQFTYQRDAVHPNQAGHWVIAQAVLQWFGDKQASAASSLDELLAKRKLPQQAFSLVQERSQILRNAYLLAAGHKRPGIKPGLPVERAVDQAAELSKQLDQLMEQREKSME